MTSRVSDGVVANIDCGFGLRRTAKPACGPESARPLVTGDRPLTFQVFP
jgi:hypothetical protein